MSKYGLDQLDTYLEEGDGPAKFTQWCDEEKKMLTQVFAEYPRKTITKYKLAAFEEGGCLGRCLNREARKNPLNFLQNVKTQQLDGLLSPNQLSTLNQAKQSLVDANQQRTAKLTENAQTFSGRTYMWCKSLEGREQKGMQEAVQTGEQARIEHLSAGISSSGFKLAMKNALAISQPQILRNEISPGAVVHGAPRPVHALPANESVGSRSFPAPVSVQEKALAEERKLLEQISNAVEANGNIAQTVGGLLPTLEQVLQLHYQGGGTRAAVRDTLQAIQEIAKSAQQRGSFAKIDAEKIVEDEINTERDNSQKKQEARVQQASFGVANQAAQKDYEDIETACKQQVLSLLPSAPAASS